jgi:hypothetical protein
MGRVRRRARWRLAHGIAECDRSICVGNKRRPIIQYRSKNKQQIVNVFTSVDAASKILKLSHKDIYYICAGKANIPKYHLEFKK